MSRARVFRSIPAVVIAVLVLGAVPVYSSQDRVRITALVIDPLTPTNLYAGTYGGGVFKSTDGGTSWSPTGLANVIVSALAINPQSPTTLYVGTDSGGVFKTVDSGANWSPTGLINIPASTLVIDPLTPDTLYAGDYGGNVYKSTDGGASWSAIRRGSLAWPCNYCGGVLALAIDPLIPTTVFGGTDETLVYDEYGELLYTLPSEVFNCTGGTSYFYTPYESVQSLAVERRTNPQIPATLYAGTSLRLFKSTDGGASWNATGLTGTGVFALAINPLTSTTVYAGTSGGGVFKSTDGGASWNATGLTSVGVLALAIDSLTPTTLYAGTDPSGVYKSTNGGANWNPTGMISWPYLSSVSLNPTTVLGGSSLTGTVILSAAAPSGGAVVALSSDIPEIASVPPNVTVASGATSADFTVSTGPVTGSIAVTIWGLYAGASNTAMLTVTPLATLSSFSLNPTSVVGGSPATGTVTLSGAAPPGGVAVALSSSNPAVAAVPASMIVPTGATIANFTISTNSVTASTTVTILVGNFYALLTVTPGPVLSTINLYPTSVPWGTASTGTVTLSGSAPGGGVTVALSSSNTALATAPASVTVPAGAATANFTVSTTACASGAVTISGTYGGVTRSAGLTVTPGPTDTIAIQQTDYFASRRELRVGAKGTNSAAMLRVYVTSTGELIGQLTKGGDGTYRGQFAWPVNPQKITVQSNFCGSATKAVTSK